MKTELKVKLLSHTPNPEKVISTAAKLCYSDSNIADIEDGLTEENIDKFLNKLMDMRHFSPIEHVSFTFGIEGISRTVLAQITRHRVASFSVKSQRYVREGQFEYYIPKQIENNELAKKMYIEHMESTQATYDAIVEELILEQLVNYISCDRVPAKDIYKAGIEYFYGIFTDQHKKVASTMEKQAIEDARYVLPNACETKMIVTMNARELLHFFNHRCCSRAQLEHQDLATEMLRQSKTIAPTLFKNAGSSCISGKCPEGTLTCGKINEMREKYKNL